MSEIVAVADEFGIDWSGDPQRIAHPYELRDGTLQTCQRDIDTFGGTSVLSNLDEVTLVPDPFPLRITQEGVLIVVARIALIQLPELQHGVPIFYPRVTKLLLANSMGSILIYHVDKEDAGVYPAGYENVQKGITKRLALHESLQSLNFWERMEFWLDSISHGF